MTKNGNAAAATTTMILIAVLLGCLATTSVHCGRVEPRDVTGGELGAEELIMVPRPYCYKACGNGRCDFCCWSPYMPTMCWDSEAKCKKECHPPMI
ncbi:hypothetical protein BDA96_10G136300 [Sorghum bicolor]|uniref:Embryo surrounding factor 1 brassicaceae domain-containing protein n=2 Tax=Sorghum bicolor TaxID=4558 RepID=A0A921U059_SORBI|nr:hypothetical protein BDA96_10G136300 [Sorghum bicolor]OQU76213.1 hypothetical protein SORBI_3010G111750 [Sorghum bicolor]